MTESLRRCLGLITLAAFLTTVSGCASTHVRALDEELARPDTGLTQQEGQKIEGYQLHSSAMTDYKGWARVTEPDSLALWVRVPVGKPDLETGARDHKRVAGPTFDLDSVQALRVVEPAPGRTAVLIVGVTAGTLVGLFALAMQDLEFNFEDPQ